VNWLEPGRGVPQLPAIHNPFRYFNSSPEVIRLVVMMYIRYPLSLRQVEDILFERASTSATARNAVLRTLRFLRDLSLPKTSSRTWRLHGRLVAW